MHWELQPAAAAGPFQSQHADVSRSKPQEVGRTQPVKETLDPVWEESINFKIPDRGTHPKDATPASQYTHARTQHARTHCVGRGFASAPPPRLLLVVVLLLRLSLVNNRRCVAIAGGILSLEVFDYDQQVGSAIVSFYGLSIYGPVAVG